jgi:hypothetical protein
MSILIVILRTILIPIGICIGISIIPPWFPPTSVFGQKMGINTGISAIQRDGKTGAVLAEFLGHYTAPETGWETSLLLWTERLTPLGLGFPGRHMSVDTTLLHE